MKFNEKLKTLREVKGYTQDEIASKLNISRQSVSKWEQGINEPDFDTTKKLCQILDCSLAELIDDDSEIETTKEQKQEKKTKWLYYGSLMLTLASALVLLALIAISQDTIITRFGLHGEITYGSRWTLLIGVAILVVGGGIAALIRYLCIKNKVYQKYKASMQLFAFITNILIVGIVFGIAAYQIKDYLVSEIAVFNLIPICALSIFIAIGPFTHPKFNKRNPVFGFRSSFTISNEVGWNKVNAFCAILLPIVGVIGYVLTIVFIENDWAMYFFLLIFAAIIPTIIYHEVVRAKVNKK